MERREPSGRGVPEVLPASGAFDSAAGRIELECGYPSAATVNRVYDAIDFQRACQGYLWALPISAMAEWQREHRETFGAGNLDYVDYATFADKLGLLTANATTPSVMAFPSMKETGPLVMDVPAGATAGGVTDFWQRPLTDSGQTGPDKGQGGRYLVLGPGHPDVWPNRGWEFSLCLSETSQEVPTRTQFDERTSWFYEAVGVSVGEEVA